MIEQELTSAGSPAAFGRVEEDKPRLGLGALATMNFGYIGIQFGWGLQMANMAPIYLKLHAHADNLPILALAGPVTGLLIQPIIGAMSDRTWSPRWGRRRPYFLAGAILASIALFFMPSSRRFGWLPRFCGCWMPALMSAWSRSGRLSPTSCL